MGVSKHIYGVKVSKYFSERTDDAVDFTDPIPCTYGTSGSSPFDNCMPWKGMQKVTFGNNVFVRIPKFWYYYQQHMGTGTEGYDIFKIADYPAEGFTVSPAHSDRGDGKGERNFVYVSRYLGGSSRYSRSGTTPDANRRMEYFQTKASGIGSGYYLIDDAMMWTIRLLYLVEFANGDCQSSIGYGCGNNSSIESTGKTDNLAYHTGTCQSNKTTYGVGVQYRNIEDLWGNVYYFVDGCRKQTRSSGLLLWRNIVTKSQTSITQSAASFGHSPNKPYLTSGYFHVGYSSGYEYLKDTQESNGATATTGEKNVLYSGGSYLQTQKDGLFSYYFTDARSSFTNVGYRLQYLP